MLPTPVCFIAATCSDRSLRRRQGRGKSPLTKQQNIRALRPCRSALQLVKKVRSDFSDKLPAKSQNKKQYFILRFWPLRRVIEREREP